MISVRMIPYTSVRDAPEILAEYAAECALTELGPINPQWDIYAKLEDAGMLQGLGVYVDGQFAGFASVLISILPHFGVKAATVESLFVGRAYRSKGAGTQLIAGVETCASVNGCKAILYSAPANGTLEAILGKRYAHTSTVFCKGLMM